MNKTLLESQEVVLYFTSLVLSMIFAISSVASHSVQNPQTLQRFLSPLYKREASEPSNDQKEWKSLPSEGFEAGWWSCKASVRGALHCESSWSAWTQAKHALGPIHQARAPWSNVPSRQSRHLCCLPAMRRRSSLFHQEQWGPAYVDVSVNKCENTMTIYLQTIPEQVHFLFEREYDTTPRSPWCWYCDTLGCSTRHIEHVLELRILERLDWWTACTHIRGGHRVELNRVSEERSGWYAQKLVRQADTTVSEKELWDQGVQVTLLIHEGAIVLHKTIACECPKENKRESLDPE